MKKFSTFLTESRVSHHTRAILPATEVLYGKKKVSVADIAATDHAEAHDPNGYYKKSGKDRKTTIQVCHVTGHSTWDSGAGVEAHKLRFVSGSGHSPHETAPFNTHHDQRGTKLGLHRVVNTIHLTNGKITHAENDSHIHDKAPLSVYK